MPIPDEIRTGDHATFPLDDMNSAADALIGRLRRHYPDMSGFTVVSMTGRGRDFLHHIVHTRLGGLLPTILSFDDYRTRRIADRTGRMAVPADEAFLRFHTLRCREEGVSPFPADSQRLFSFLTTIAEFSVSIEELRALDRIGQEQADRIERFFTTMEAYRDLLATEGLFYAPFEATRFADLATGECELFFGLPMMTPLNRRFFGRIPCDRLFIDMPLFGPHMPSEPPEYETALSLIRSIGIRERRVSGQKLCFSELAERAALPALLSHEIGVFLQQARSDSKQLFIVPLDERLSFYLWELLFQPLGGQVNFAPWLPFAHFAAAHRLRTAVRSGKGLVAVRRDLVAELTAGWNEMDGADRSAFEAAITLCDELDRLCPLMEDEWLPLAEHLIAVKKLRLHGRRSSPIQVVGLGDATGVPYERAILLPMNSGIFPRKSFNGPYLNQIHLPRIHRAQFEADDLELRQFLAFGRTAHIAALYDQAKAEAPSTHFSFLATEFGEKPAKRLIAPTPFKAPASNPAIENTGELQERLRQFTWSFSALKRLFTCPYRFILEDIQQVKPPPCFNGEEHANLLIGNFLHHFFTQMIKHRPAVERWRERFEENWESNEELRDKLPDQAVRKAIVQSHLADIAAWEKETDRRLLFSDDVIEAELTLSAPFGGGRHRLKGRIDRLQRDGEKELVTDLKYKEKKKVSEKGRLADRVDETDSFDDRFQLVLYAYLVLHNKRATAGRLDAAHIFLRPRVRGDYEGRLAAEDLAGCEDTMERIARRLDRMLAEDRFIPNYRADGCPNCPYKALCLKPDLYRMGGRPW